MVNGGKRQMKKQVMIIGIIVVVLSLGLSGCETEPEGKQNETNGDTEPSNGTETELSGIIAFTTLEDIYLINPDGTNPIKLTDGTPRIESLFWSPDGTKIAFMSMDDRLFVIDAEGTNSIEIGACDIEPCWSSDGEKLVYGVYNDGLYIANADGTNVIKLVDCFVRDVVFSPDGQKIAYVCEQELHGLAYLYVINSDGSENMKLINDSISITYSPYRGLTWSPDGTKLTYRKQGQRVYVMNSDGSDQLKFEEYCRDPAWSPDNKKIVYWNANDGGLYAANPDATNKNQIANSGKKGISPPCWSPDGTHIVYAVTGKIYIVNSDGSDSTYIYDGYFPQWSPS